MSIPSVEALRTGRLLVIAPHMDDEILGCGGLLLLHHDKRRLHCIYATAGERSPAPLLPWQGELPGDLAAIRARESASVLAEIGIPRENASYLGLPDGGLARSRDELGRLLERQIERVRPEFILVPFRFDLHADHVAVHRAVRDLAVRGRVGAPMLEYFVYVRWQFAGEADIRRRVRTDRLIELDISAVADRKRALLSLYGSQTRRLYPWQDSAVLTTESVRSRCREPEQFMVSAPGEPLRACFSGGSQGLVIAHYAYRLGKRRKDQLRAIFRRRDSRPLAPEDQDR